MKGLIKEKYKDDRGTAITFATLFIVGVILIVIFQ